MFDLILFFVVPLSYYDRDDSEDDDEKLDIYKMTRKEYFWSMLTASSFAECWSTFKDGELD